MKIKFRVKFFYDIHTVTLMNKFHATCPFLASPSFHCQIISNTKVSVDTQTCSADANLRYRSAFVLIQRYSHMKIGTMALWHHGTHINLSRMMPPTQLAHAHKHTHTHTHDRGSAAKSPWRRARAARGVVQ